eukprot:9026348-Heterocapsa_arctica.AAC.1
MTTTRTLLDEERLDYIEPITDTHIMVDHARYADDFMCVGCVQTPANVIWRDQQWDQAYEQCCAPANLWQSKNKKQIL